MNRRDLLRLIASVEDSLESDGSSIARDLIRSVVGVERWQDNIDFADTDDRRGEGAGSLARPAPLIRTLIRQLQSSDVISGRRRRVLADILRWYDQFWQEIHEFRFSASRRSNLLQVVSQYAAGERVGSFMPYYDQLIIDPGQFATWRDEISNEFESLTAASNRWRGPRGLLLDYLYADVIRDTPEVTDKHVCGSTLLFVLGETAYSEFDLSLCSICAGTVDQRCGEIVVDIND